jgi:glycosyltransferase involved in cell wall biosynthesis
MKTVSVIIPCYNYGHWLPEAIESALSQTHKPHEVIVVNDGSTDNTGEVVRRFPDVKCIYQDNKGLPAARNTGIKAAKSEWIVPLDADDTLEPAFIECCLKEKADIVSCSMHMFGEKIADCHLDMRHPTHHDFIKSNRCLCVALYRKKMWERIGGYDEKMVLGYEDWEFWIRATAAGYTVTVLDEMLFNYRKHGESLVNVSKRNHLDIKKYIDSKHPKGGLK